MVNIGFNSATLLGLLDVILALAYLVLSIALPLTRARDLGSIGITLYLIQAFIAPVILLLSGFILIFQGWRLDPILQFAYLLLHLLVVYLAVKDVILFRLGSRRNQRS
jgi:uncharacterized membrane protein YhaH (DUF805 family)